MKTVIKSKTLVNQIIQLSVLSLVKVKPLGFQTPNFRAQNKSEGGYKLYPFLIKEFKMTLISTQETNIFARFLF